MPLHARSRSTLGEMSKPGAKHLRGACALALAVSLSGACVSPGTPSGTLGISGSRSISAVGDTARLGATFTDAKGAADVTSQAQWNSSAQTVATVSAGVVTAVGPGRTRIFASYKDAESSIEVVVGSDLRLRGRVVTALTGLPVLGATLLIEGTPQSSADESGAFDITWQSPTLRQLTVFGDGFLSRDLWVRPTTKSSVDIDVISLAAPFNAETYRKLVFNGYDGPPSSLLRWTAQPRFYIKTTVEGGLPNLCNCTHLTPGDVDAAAAAIRRTVPLLTGGQFSSVQVDSGPDDPAVTTDTIVIRMARDLGPGVGGRAQVGANPGRIDLLVADPASCGHNVHPWTVSHEVGHALGFWHHDDVGIMAPLAGTCSAGPSLVEQHLAAVAYSRPVGTNYPDFAPQSTAFLRSSSALRVIVN
jgi:hypothetical protein